MVNMKPSGVVAGTTISDFWSALFGAEGVSAVRVEMRQLKKHGRPFLLLPKGNAPAAITLGLYPAQTFRARGLKTLLRFLAGSGLPVGTERVSLSVSTENAFLKFLAAQAGSAGDIPAFGILAGNPAHDTQRFIIILFD